MSRVNLRTLVGSIAVIYILIFSAQFASFSTLAKNTSTEEETLAESPLSSFTSRAATSGWFSTGSSSTDVGAGPMDAGSGNVVIGGVFGDSDSSLLHKGSGNYGKIATFSEYP